MAMHIMKQKKEAARNKKLNEIFLVIKHTRCDVMWYLVIPWQVMSCHVLHAVMPCDSCDVQERGDPVNERISMEQIRDVFRIYEVPRYLFFKLFRPTHLFGHRFKSSQIISIFFKVCQCQEGVG